MPKSTASFTLEPADNRKLTQLCGPHDSNLQQIAAYFDVKISNRGHEFQITGAKEKSEQAKKAIINLFTEIEPSKQLDSNAINLVLHAATIPQKPTKKSIAIATPKIIIKPRTPNQYTYLDNILNHDINFAIGPAGTGKTYLAVAYAVQCLEQELVSRIIIARPVVEAGERLGYLPGDIAQKVDPYLRPIYDALYEMLGFGQVTKLMEHNIIEIAPLAFMRGRTLNDAIIILDEAQNTTSEQMKMFLTRLGFGSKAIITGDITQIDLPKSTLPGLKNALDLLQGIKNIGFTFFQAIDVVRHPLVQDIVKAYAKEIR